MNDESPYGEDAALRGNPSFVWRAGQTRRLDMVRRIVALEGRRILDVGCGVGMYTAAFSRYTEHAFGIEVELDRAWRPTRTSRESLRQSEKPCPSSTIASMSSSPTKSWNT